MKKNRLEQIKEIIEKYGKVTYEELENLLPDVSNMTLRRDLITLEEQNVILRIRGGAISVDEIKKQSEQEFVTRFSDNVQEKKEIAEKTIKLISPKSCIFIDSGSTTLYFAKELPNNNYYIVTNALNVATEILRKSLPTVTLLGGDVNRNNLVTIGKSSLDFLETINIELAVMTATGFTPEKGCFTCGSQDEMEIKNAVIKSASKVIMLLDSSKVGKNTPYTFAKLKNVHYLVVDKNFPHELRERIESIGTTVV
jgi:DeoR/GlpR family transcriptional regulator of sugar metabolism